MRDTFKAAVPALALLTALTACGGATSGSTEAPTAPTSKATTEPTAVATTSKATTAKGKGACTADGLEVSIALQGTGETDEKGMVIITNESGKNCTVRGWLTFALVNAADETVDVPTTTVNEPGPAVTVEIKAGGSAFAGIKWTQCDKGDTTCGVGNTIRWSLDGSLTGPVAELDGFPEPEKSDITMKALKVGTVQPSNQGVTAW